MGVASGPGICMRPPTVENSRRYLTKNKRTREGHEIKGEGPLANRNDSFLYKGIKGIEASLKRKRKGYMSQVSGPDPPSLWKKLVWIGEK